MKVLVDGDILVYRCGFAAEHTIYTILYGTGVVAGRFESAAEYKQYVQEHDLQDFSVEREREVEPLSHALANVKSVMNRITNALNPTEVHVFLSQGDCFRSDIATMKKYKGNREGAPRPVYYKEIRDYLVERYDATVFNRLEADDALAMCQEEAGKTCIVSIDKDLLQVPGYHYNWVKEEKYLITPEIGLNKLYQQVLSGDPTDNIPGIPRIGEKTARKKLKGLTQRDALVIACRTEWNDFIYKREGCGKLVKGAELDGNGYVYYPHWNGEDEVRKNSEQLMEEVYQLVEVGGEKAYEEADKAGETVLLPGGKKR